MNHVQSARASQSVPMHDKMQIFEEIILRIVKTANHKLLRFPGVRHKNGRNGAAIYRLFYVVVGRSGTFHALCRSVYDFTSAKQVDENKTRTMSLCCSSFYGVTTFGVRTSFELYFTRE